MVTFFWTHRFVHAKCLLMDSMLPVRYLNGRFVHAKWSLFFGPIVSCTRNAYLWTLCRQSPPERSFRACQMVSVGPIVSCTRNAYLRVHAASCLLSGRFVHAKSQLFFGPIASCTQHAYLWSPCLHVFASDLNGDVALPLHNHFVKSLLDNTW